MLSGFGNHPLLIIFVSFSIFTTPTTTATKLSPGDTCQIVAPLSAGDPNTLGDVVRFVQDFGLTPSISLDIYNISGPDNLTWYSNTDEFRAQDLARAILSPEVKVIWLINGGSGAYRTLEHLDKLLPPPPLPIPPKPIIGFSAVTPIFIYMQEKYGWPVIHGAVLDLVVLGYYNDSVPITIDPLKELLLHGAKNITLPPLTRLDDGAVFEQPLVSTVVGGSMRQITLSMGTPYKINATGKILFMEVHDPSADSANDFVDTLIYTGIFDDVDAIVFGDFMAELVTPAQVTWILDRFASEGKVKAPIFKVSGIGHWTPNHPVVFGTKAEISLVSGKTYQLVVDNMI